MHALLNVSELKIKVKIYILFNFSDNCRINETFVADLQLFSNILNFYIII